MHSISTREAARKLRLAGQSYNEISGELRVAKSTLHIWLEGLQLSSSAQARIRARVRTGSLKGLMKRNKLQTHRARQRAVQNRIEGQKQMPLLNRELLSLLGAALYWGEGYKRAKIVRGRQVTDHPVSLSNSDPKLVKAFLRFLRECCGVGDEDIVVNVRIYQHMNTEQTVAFWQKVTALPRQNFTKIYYGVSIASARKRGYNRLPYGTVQIRVNSTALYHRIMGMIDGIAAQV